MQFIDIAQQLFNEDDVDAVDGIIQADREVIAQTINVPPTFSQTAFPDDLVKYFNTFPHECPLDLRTPCYIFAPTGGLSRRNFLIEFLASKGFTNSSKWDGPVQSPANTDRTPNNSAFVFSVRYNGGVLYLVFGITRVYWEEFDQRPAHWGPYTTAKGNIKKEMYDLSPLQAVLTQGQMAQCFGTDSVTWNTQRREKKSTLIYNVGADDVAHPEPVIRRDRCSYIIQAIVVLGILFGLLVMWSHDEMSIVPYVPPSKWLMLNGPDGEKNDGWVSVVTTTVVCVTIIMYKRWW